MKANQICRMVRKLCTSYEIGRINDRTALLVTDGHLRVTISAQALLDWLGVMGDGKVTSVEFFKANRQGSCVWLRLEVRTEGLNLAARFFAFPSDGPLPVLTLSDG